MLARCARGYSPTVQARLLALCSPSVRKATRDLVARARARWACCAHAPTWYRRPCSWHRGSRAGQLRAMHMGAGLACARTSVRCSEPSGAAALAPCARAHRSVRGRHESANTGRAGARAGALHARRTSGLKMVMCLSYPPPPRLIATAGSLACSPAWWGEARAPCAARDLASASNANAKGPLMVIAKPATRPRNEL